MHECFCGRFTRFIFHCKICRMTENKELDENAETIDEANEVDHSAESAGSAAQIIIGEIEKIGGILTGDPVTQAEGDYNIAAGTLREDANENLEETDEENS